jgi:hypothetical protein
MSMSATERASQAVKLDPVAIDEIVDRLGEVIVERVVEALMAGPTRTDLAPNAEGLWTTRQVAAHYGVTPSFVYQHADELGCIRLGGGTCPRLRFDPNVLRERWATVGQPASAPTERRTRAASRRSRSRRERNFELLEFDRDP